MSTPLGTTLGGRYRLESKVGSGGMSTVYRAYDETLERTVAVKLMNQEVAGDSAQLERFRREARAVARISHPNVVRVIDAGEDQGRPFIVFEYIDGETLKARIRRVGRLPIPEAVAYGIEIARALGAAHANQVVHRDVKPQNVLIDREGTAKVTDFGIARTLEEDGLTDDGRVLGTTDYVSPEQALGQPVTGQSDLYSLGVALYEMLTGELPFNADSQVAVALKHVHDELPDLRQLRPEVSAALAAVVETATAKDLDQRYSGDEAMIADLEQALALETVRTGDTDGEVTTVLKTLPPEIKRRVPLSLRHRTRTLAAAIVVALLIAGAIAYFTLASRGNGNGGKANAPGAGATLVRLCAGCAHAYNPDGIGGIEQNNAAAHYAVDGNPATAWTTQTYYDGTLNKPGVGIYVSAPAALSATGLTVTSTTPRYRATIYGSTTRPNPSRFAGSGWTKLAATSDAATTQRFSLASGGHAYRYYLVWITQLPPGGQTVSINEIKLYR